ncbi:MAG: 2TM domain-containing protein [Thermoplasmatota archaeon]
MPSEEDLWKKAHKRAEEKVGFFIHLSCYIMVNILLVVLWYISSGGDLSVFPWFIIPMLGWGIGIVAHGVGAFAGGSFQDKIAEKEYKKMKRK